MSSRERDILSLFRSGAVEEAFLLSKRGASSGVDIRFFGEEFTSSTLPDEVYATGGRFQLPWRLKQKAYDIFWNMIVLKQEVGPWGVLLCDELID